jgi:hypothetical protein
MSYTIIGNSLIARANSSPGTSTYISAEVPATSRGILKVGYVYLVTGGPTKVKIFRDDGTNFIFIGESGFVTGASAAIVTIPAFIPVEKGDLIAVYMSSGSVQRDLSGSNCWSKAGDIVATSLKSGWSNSTAVLNSTQGYVFDRSNILII